MAVYPTFVGIFPQFQPIMKHRVSLYGLIVLFAALTLMSCSNKEKELQEMVEKLELEINQIDEQKKLAEAELDSVIHEKERIAEEAFEAKNFGQEQLEKLKQANGALYTARKRNEALQAELNQWKMRADSLAAENAQLKAKIAELNNRVAAAEQRAIEAENRATAAETKVMELQAKLNKTFFVQNIAVQGTNDKGETYSKDQIKTRTDILNVDVKLGRPEGMAASAQTLTLKITDPKGAQWYVTEFTTANDQARVVIQVKELKLDLEKGRYAVQVLENGAEKYNGFFTVS